MAESTLAAKKARVTKRLDRLLFCAEGAFQCVLRRGGPVYIAAASSLIASVVFVYFAAVFPQILASDSRLVAAGHLVSGLFCLLNIIFNYVQCVITDPGSTEILDTSGYQMVAMQCQRRCRRCRKPKPPLAHHCHICSRCVLRMDHHCPWMNNCIGFHNYRFFVLFTFYLWAGSAYSAWMLLWELGRIGRMSQFHMGEAVYPYALLVPFVLSAAVSIALTALMGWHFFLIWQGQSTIDMLNFWRDSKEAKAQGTTLIHPYNLGLKRNFQEVFDVSGHRLWWMRWMLPSSAKRRGDGIFFPTMYDSLQVQPQDLDLTPRTRQHISEVLSQSDSSAV
ncbi:hypothetical protein WJX82_004923 [Trebouxia sp. C0006]